MSFLYYLLCFLQFSQILCITWIYIKDSFTQKDLISIFPTLVLFHYFIIYRKQSSSFAKRYQVFFSFFGNAIILYIFFVFFFIFVFVIYVYNANLQCEARFRLCFIAYSFFALSQSNSIPVHIYIWWWCCFSFNLSYCCWAKWACRWARERERKRGKPRTTMGLH